MTWLDDRALRGLKELLGQGDVLDGRWELLQPIGEGGMAVVHAALDRDTGREVAIKILRGEGEHDEARFLREVTALEGASHPAIVKYVAHGVHEGSRFVVMERLVGTTLGDRLRRGALSFADTVAVAERIAGGLAAVHDAGITHRDLKPANVFLAADSVLGARLVDFGLARRGDTTTLTGKGTLVGTPGYMAPEQVRGNREIGPTADVFAFGCILHECVTGRALFVAEDDETLFSSILLSAAPALDDVPADFASLVARMLDKDASRRPASRTLEEEFHRICSSTPRTAVAEGDIIAGKYRVDGFLGAGGMGTVVAATHLELGTRVALKLLRDSAVKEARAASQLESEHVARVLDVGKTDDGTPFLVMEHLSGTDLARHLAEHGPLPPKTTVRYLLQTCSAMAEAHALGIVHRDLKPSNLFLAKRRSGDDIVKVLDFGISKTRDDDESPAHGSLPYMSPEQRSGNADARSDIYSLGVVLHELVTGKRPGDARPPRDLEPIIRRCLSPEPEQRFQNVGELATALTSRPRRRLAPALVAAAGVVACVAWLWPAASAATSPAPSEPRVIPSTPETTPSKPALVSVPAEAPNATATASALASAKPPARVAPVRPELDLRDPRLLTR